MSKLQTIDADTLLSTPLPATRFVVDRLLPEGLHILAGAPKVGKSWLALWLCLCVAKGESVWDFAVTKGTVLYLCLEDSLTRIQNRLFQITEDAPDTLHFAILWAMNRRQEQAGRKKERRYSLPRFYLPEIEWRLVAVAAMMLGGLFMTWWFLLRG